MKRSASTLIEVALSLPILTMLLVLAISGVHQVMRVSRLAKDRGQISYSLSRLEQSFRADAHEAEAINVQPKERDELPSLRMTLPNMQQIIYRAKLNRIERELIDGDGKSHAESFVLFSENQVDFAVESDKQVRMSIRRVHRDQQSASRLELFVRTMIGRPKLETKTSQKSAGAQDE